jgi:hypothetical protein
MLMRSAPARLNHWDCNFFALVSVHGRTKGATAINSSLEQQDYFGVLALNAAQTVKLPPEQKPSR